VFRVVTASNLHANKHIVVQNLSFRIMGAYLDLFMMKNTARVLVAEGYIGGVRRHQGSSITCFASAVVTCLTCCYASRKVTTSPLDTLHTDARHKIDH
jgi:hypothetical protein